MRSLVRACVTIGAAVLLVAGLSASVAAQGVTTASVRGTIMDDTGAPVDGATVLLVNQSTGQRYSGVSRGDGRYNIENVPVGGPYTLTARLIGLQEAGRDLFYLTLQQQLILDLTMTRAAVQLEALVVTAEEQDPLTATSRTGTVGMVSDTAVSRLPTLNRNFTDFVATVPQIASIQDDAPSMGGGHNRQNSIQIDGVSDNDLFGLGSTGQPGGQVDAKSISLEAVKEYQVLIAPFDVRQSGFSGGIINAVTKRGTNRWHGSGFWYYQQDALIRDTLPYNEAVFGEYVQHQRGFSVGGPIIRDKLHIFAAAEWQTRGEPSGGTTIGREAATDVRVSRDSAQRMVDILADNYQADAGSYEAITMETPQKNIFGRLDFQLNNDHTLTVRHNYVSAAADLSLSRYATSYEFSNARYRINNETNSTMAQLNSTLGGGRYFNELRIGYLRVRDVRDPMVDYAWLDVDNYSDIEGRSYRNSLRTGADVYSQRNRLNQNVFELTDDLTFARGRHTITVGTHNEWISFDNVFFPRSIGSWEFGSLAELEAGTPDNYEVQVPFPGETDRYTAGRAEWSIFQLGLYLQDVWDVTPRLKVTGGLRIDVPIIGDKPRANADIANSSAMNSHLSAQGLDPVMTDKMPSGNFHLAPRIGVNWDLSGTRSTVLRGGAGLFTGRPAYVWLSNAYTNTGRDIALVECSGALVPEFNSTTMRQPPQTCADGSGLDTPRSQINYFDSNFHFPQQLKATLALDQRLPGNIIGTLEFLYTKHVNTVYLQEMNIPSTALATNSEGRQLFGDPGNYGYYGVTPTRIDGNFVQVLRHTNKSKDRSYSMTAQLQKRFARSYEFNFGYTYQNVKDLTSLSSSIATSNFGYTPLSAGGNPNEKVLTTSRFDVPHRIVLSGTVDIPVPNVPTSFTLLYVGQSGTPYSWIIDGDANGDGYEGAGISGRNNDMVLVPDATGSNFTPDGSTDLEEYQALISNELFPDLMPCLKEVQDAGGGIPVRNTCRNPWRNRFDMSLRMGVGRAIGGTFHRLTLVADVFNVLNLMSADWGIIKATSFYETRELLELEGYDTANDRGVYQYTGPAVLAALEDYEAGLLTADEARSEIERNVFSASNISSRWRIQFGLRYDF